MVKTLELAIAKAAALPEAAQEALGREILKHIDDLAALRADIEIGIQQLDAGLGRELDLKELLQRARARHAGKA
jgi:hypothetical protein